MKKISLKNAKTANDFQAWRKDTLAFYRNVVGIETDHNALPLEATTTESILLGSGVTRLRIEYSTTDGLRIPAFLFVPKTDKPVPAVIVYHGHGEGKINSAEGEGTNENALARFLAETLGCITLAPDTRSFGEFIAPGAQSHIDYNSGLRSSGRLFMTKLMEDGFQDMALLRSLPEADADRIGVAGISMGSWRALNHAVLQENVAATVVAGLFLPWEFLFSDKHCACQHIPELARRMDAEDLAAAIFPRHLMIQWGLDDKYYQHGAKGLISRTSKIADALGFADRLTIDRRPGLGHGFSNPEIAEFFEKLFGSKD